MPSKYPLPALWIGLLAGCEPTYVDPPQRPVDGSVHGVDTDPHEEPEEDVQEPIVGEGPWSLVRIPAGSFEIGCTAGQTDCLDRESTYTVTLTHDLLLSQFEVTRAQWREVMGYDPLAYQSTCDDCPVGYMTWNEAASFLNKISRLEGLQPCYYCEVDAQGNDLCWSHVDPFGGDLDPYTCSGYRLPTEAEWESSARCGEDTPFSGGQLSDDVGWVLGNSFAKPHAVGLKEPNACGLYDMTGNVFEWNHDWFVAERTGSQVDPVGPVHGSDRNARGGSWAFSELAARVSYRDACRRQDLSFEDLGLRVARTALD